MPSLQSIIDSIDRDKNKAGFQILSAPAQARLNASKFVNRVKTNINPNTYSPGVTNRVNAFVNQGVNRVKAMDPMDLSITRGFANIQPITQTFLTPFIGQKKASNIGYGLRGASQLTPFQLVNSTGLDKRGQKQYQANAPTTSQQLQAQNIGKAIYGTALTAPLGGSNYLANIGSRAIQGTALGVGMNTVGNVIKGNPLTANLKESAISGLSNSWQLAFTNAISDKVAGKLFKTLTPESMKIGGTLMKNAARMGSPIAKKMFVRNAIKLFERALLEAPIETTWFTAINKLTGDEKRKFVEAWIQDLPGNVVGNLAFAGLAVGKQGIIDLNPQMVDAAIVALKKNDGFFAGPRALGFDKASYKYSNPIDRKVRFEVSDRQSGIKTTKLRKIIGDAPNDTTKASTRLGEFYDHPGLYRQYPELKNLRVNFESILGEKGHFDQNTFTLTVNPKLSTAEIRSVILHELQHGIQNIEGFAPGASPSMFKDDITKDLSSTDQYFRAAGELEARAAQRREAMSPEKRKRTDPYFAEMKATGTTNPNDYIVRYGDGNSLSKAMGQEPVSDIKPTKDILPQKPTIPGTLGVKESIVQPTKGVLSVPSESIIPQKGKLNVNKLDLTEEQQKLVRSADTAEPTVIGNKEVIEASKLTTGAKGAISDEQQKKLLAQQLNNRQAVVTLTKEFNQMKQAGASEKELTSKFTEIAEQSRIAQQGGTFAGRLLQAQKILANDLATPQQKILALLDNAGVKKEKYIKDAIRVDWNNGRSVVEFYRKYVPPKLGEVIDEVRYTNMLSSPLTHITNIAANLFQTGVVAPVEKTITGTLDWVKSSMTGAERQYYASDGINYAKGFYSSMPEAWKNFKNTLSGKNMTVKPDMERVPLSTKGVLNTYSTPLRALEAADQFFMTLVKNAEVESMQGRGLSKEAISTASENAAKYRLFRQAFDPSGKTGQGGVLKVWDQYNSLVSKLRRLPGGKWIVPFLQTPTNILKQGVEYSPLGITTIPGSKKPLEQLSKAIIGSSVFMGAYGLLNSTEFTWDVPTGEKEKSYFYAANMQPYSIKIGDKWVSYSKLGPLAYPIAMAAALRYAEKYGLPSDKENKVSTALGGMLKFFSDQSYVKQLGDTIDAMRTGKGIVGAAKAEATNMVTQLIPYKSFLSWLSRIIDPISRNPNGVVETIKSQLPEVSKSIEPYYNPVTKQPSQRSNPILNAVSPLRISTSDEKAESMYKYLGNAKKAYSNIMLLPEGERAAMYKKIKAYSPAMASQILKVKKEVAMGVTKEDKDMLNANVADGERSYLIYRKLRSLKTEEEKAKLWKEYVDKKIITKDVSKQLRQLILQGE